MVGKVLIVRGREITLRLTTHIELGVLHRTVVGAVVHSAAEVIVKRVVPGEAAAACRALDHHRPTTSKCWAQMRHVLVNIYNNNINKVLIVRGREIALRLTTNIEFGVLHRTVVDSVVHSAADVILKCAVPIEAAASCRALDHHRPTTSKCWAQNCRVLVQNLRKREQK